ncbi:MAG: 4-hydroxy-tetrahydrodipicolinate reductase [Chloroflexi bacterium]|nr:4-hydroxy-tetrahydrodipicolinate reductase [Chloroflexota bacterium]
MAPVRVVVQGASGNMGQQVLATLCQQRDMEPVGAVDIKAKEEYLSLPNGSGLIPFSSDVASLLAKAKPQVVVDFSHADAVMPLARAAAQQKVNLVVGTTGVAQAQVDEIGRLCAEHSIGAVVAPNFSLGAVVLSHLAKIAGRYFDYADIIEMHHERKADAPSGTALAMARAMAASRGRPFEFLPTSKEVLAGTRGGVEDGIGIHSLRLPGLLAHHEIVLGGLGQTLVLRHDTISRESFMPGVLLAIREVVNRKGLVFGLDTLLGLGA